MQFSDAIWWRHNKSKMADGRHIENLFLVTSRRHIDRSTRNSERRWRIACRYRSCDQNCNFRKLKMADGRHFEIALTPYLSRELSDFDEIWYADVYLNSHHGFLTKSRKFANSRWRTDAILKIVFGYISAPYWPIDAKFGREMKNHMPIQVTWPKLQFSKIQDGGRPPFWKQFSVFTSFL